jgi:hypothetical protein
VVVVEGATIILEPVPNKTPPQVPEYQYATPFTPVADKVTFWFAHTVLLDELAPVGSGVPPAQFVERNPRFRGLIDPQPEEQQLPNCK